MQRFAACVEYDGAAFCGWQVQAGQRTVEAVLLEALGRVADQPTEAICAGRTDSGVHAVGQIIHFDSPVRRSARAWLLGTNANLPDDVALHWVRPVPEHFHARYSALSRTYRYRILNRAARSALARGRAWWLHGALDIDAMHRAARHLLGEHDFSAFRAAGCQSHSPVRRLDALEVSRDGDSIVVEATANAFLHHMVRNLVGLLVHIGRGEAPPGWVAEVLAGRDRTRAAATAPAEGLYLQYVRYDPAFALPGPDRARVNRSAMIGSHEVG